ncbi:site-specific DNA-methyltransferase [Gordonia amicalis]|uniref:Methyltransferase n=1 Tax=Gordonia amicalis TaxID=89053 RepID=A0AAE4R1K9_9ACTN|nr:site-specific DNA-methyltransferase [Gordonia amicalis]MDV6310746.1 site-specific DNA-methyltransferase [Gordonia amicalis]
MTPSASPAPMLPRRELLVGDATARLRSVPDASIDTVLTSPPYFRLRDYGITGQLGLESSVDEWVSGLLAVLNELARVLVPTGAVWLNLGDSFAAHPRDGAQRKSLLLAPEKVAVALQANGWIIRNKIIWAKPNPMPSSVRDRLTCTYEVVYLLARQPTYFFDLDAIRQPHRSAGSAAARSTRNAREAWRGPNSNTAVGLDIVRRDGRVGHVLGKNPGDVWVIAPGSVRGSNHHAVFPERLAARCIAAGCPEARCQTCRQPWRRDVVRRLGATAVRSALHPMCQCDAPPEPGIVLDPFMGAGTTAVAAETLERDWLGIELNPDFAAAATARIRAERHRRAHQQRAGPESAAA